MKFLIYSIFSKFPTLFFSNKKKLRVLAYHTIPEPKKFEKQLLHLKENYNIINIQQLRKFIKNDAELPEKPLLITFDDGDISVFENGLPILKKFNLTAVLFVITGLIDSNDTFWWRKVERIFQDEGKSYIEARKQVNFLKKVPEAERKKYLEDLPNITSRQLTNENLKEMAKNGIFIANHTHTHPMVDKCTTIELKREFQLSKKKFEEWRLPGYNIFAYPNGNWDKKTEELLQQEDIKFAFLFDHKINKTKINPLRISRIRVDSDIEINEFKVKVSGLHPKLMALKQIFS